MFLAYDGNATVFNKNHPISYWEFGGRWINFSPDKSQSVIFT